MANDTRERNENGPRERGRLRARGPHPAARPYGDEDFSTEDEYWREPSSVQDWRRERAAPSYGYTPRGPHAGKGPKGYRRSDERIAEDVNQALADDPELDATEIEVSAKDGEVTLRGTVSDRQSKRRAEECVEHLPGVQDVRNELRTASSGSGAATSTGRGRGGEGR